MPPISSVSDAPFSSNRAPFIVFEGIDGSGVSTQTSLLASALRKSGQKVFVTKQPSDGPVGAMIRLALSRRLVPREGAAVSTQAQAEIMAMYFAADRLDHFHNMVLPKLNEGITVLNDRYYLSSYAYQGLEVDDKDWLGAINAKVMRPDLTIFLDVDPSISIERIRRRTWHFELFETESYLTRVHKAYLETIETFREHGERIVVLDGVRPPDEVHRDVLEVVRQLPALR